MGQFRGGRQITRQFSVGTMLAAIVVTILAGCGSGDPETDATPEATPAPTAAPSPTPAPELGAVTWSTVVEASGAPVDELDSFARDTPVIYAVVEVDAIPAGDTLSAVWSLDDAPIDAIASTLIVDGDAGSGWVAFALSWEGESLWPVGTLGVTITATSGAVTTGAIRIIST